MNRRTHAAPPRSAQIRLAQLLGISAAVGAIGLAALHVWDGSPQALLSAIRDEGAQAWLQLGLGGIIALCGVVAFPLSIALAATAILLPPAFAAIIAASGMTIGAAAGYALGRRRPAAVNAPQTAVARLQAWIVRHPLIAATGARFMVGVPFAVQNLLLGACLVPRRAYAIGSSVGIGANATGVFALSLAGEAALQRIERTWAFGWIGVGVVALLAIALAIRARQRRRARA